MDTNVGGIVLALTYKRWTWMASSLGVFSPKLSYTSYVCKPGWTSSEKESLTRVHHRRGHDDNKHTNVDNINIMIGSLLGRW